MEPGFHAASPLSLAAFEAVCAAVVSSLACGAWVSARRGSADPLSRAGAVLLGAAGWVAALSAVVASGWMQARPMPRLLLFAGAVILASIGLGCSRVGRWLAQGVSIGWLVAFQGFRLPLELILHGWARDGVIPASMTWTGSNWDVVTGALAVLLAPLAGRRRSLAWTVDLVGIATLANVVRVAVLSSPLPFAWRVEPPLQLAFHLPYAWILPVCVGGALAGHVVLTRALIAGARGPVAGHRP